MGTPPRPLRLIGGDLALDLANTVDEPGSPDEYDHMGTGVEVAAWAEAAGALSADRARSLATDLAGDADAAAALAVRARQLRAAVVAFFGAAAGPPDGGPHDGGPHDGGPRGTSSASTSSDGTGTRPGGVGIEVVRVPWAALRPLVADAVAHAGLSGEPGRIVHDWDHLPPADALLHAVAGAAGQLALSPDLTRIKRCGACPWLFLDRSRNGSRRWCDMGDCGTARKMERYTARRAARRAARRSGTTPG